MLHTYTGFFHGGFEDEEVVAYIENDNSVPASPFDVLLSFVRELVVNV